MRSRGMRAATLNRRKLEEIIQVWSPLYTKLRFCSLTIFRIIGIIKVRYCSWRRNERFFLEQGVLL